MRRNKNISKDEYYKNKAKIKKKLDEYEEGSKEARIKYGRAGPRLKASSIRRGYFERVKTKKKKKLK